MNSKSKQPHNEELLLMRMNICSLEDKLAKLNEDMENTEEDEEYNQMET